MKRINRTYKNKLTAKYKSRLYWKILIVLVFILGMGFGGYMFTFPEADAQEYSVNIPYKATQANLSVKQRVDNYLEARGVSENFKSRIHCLIEHESNYNEFAVGVNTGGSSYDRGLLQWNNKLAPIQIDNECSFSAECSLNEFVNYINKGGSWDRWHGYSANCL